MGSVDHWSGHFLCWHTRDSVATDLTVKLTPCIDGLVHNAVVLALHALSSGTLAALAEVDDGDHRVLGVDLDLVVGVLDDLNGHGWCPLLMNIV